MSKKSIEMSGLKTNQRKVSASECIQNKDLHGTIIMTEYLQNRLFKIIFAIFLHLCSFKQVRLFFFLTEKSISMIFNFTWLAFFGVAVLSDAR
jgi:hypothetical protein